MANNLKDGDREFIIARLNRINDDVDSIKFDVKCLLWGLIIAISIAAIYFG